MPDYSKTVIYKICCKDVNVTDIYVGHTTNLYKRKDRHKYCCTTEKCKVYNTHIYKFIRENGGLNNWEIIKLYDYPCNSLKEASIEERKCLNKLCATLNTKKPYESFEEAKSYQKEYDKEYNKLRVNCPNCNKIISKKHLNEHMKTKKCQSFNQTE